jgi:hypothetical protein
MSSAEGERKTVFAAADLAEEAQGERSLSEQDRRDQVGVMIAAMEIHIRKERVRRGLWKESTAVDQARMMRVKVERIISILERCEREGINLASQPELLANLLEEHCDIINYSCFGHRLLDGRADPLNTLR